MSVPGCLALGALLAAQAIPAPRTSSSVAADLRAEMRSIRDREADDLARLADRLAANGEGAAEAVRARIEPPPPEDGPLRFVPPPDYLPADRLGGAGVPEEARTIRTQAARSLMDLARRAAAPGAERFGIATECLRGALERDPDNAEARRLLGYLPHKGGWALPQALADLKAGKVLDATFGWVPADWVPHLRNGELPARGRPGAPVAWLPADEADAQRREMASGWVITTEHFEIRANVPLNEAIIFGRHLEAVRDLFFTLFADLLDPKDLPLAARFRDPDLEATPAKRRHQVWYFAERAEYIDFFRRLGGDERRSLGYYMPRSEAQKFRLPPRSYFFRDPGGVLGAEATLAHEASHQVLFETTAPANLDRNVGNYWIWEGLGTYFETFAARPDGSYQIGGRIGPRMAQARHEAEEGPFLSISELAKLGKARFKDEEAVVSYYAESMALVVFLMHAEGGRWRDEFLDYVRDACRARFRPGSAARPLIDRVGGPDSGIDDRFRRFVLAGPKAG